MQGSTLRYKGWLDANCNILTRVTPWHKSSAKTLWYVAKMSSLNKILTIVLWGMNYALSHTLAIIASINLSSITTPCWGALDAFIAILVTMLDPIMFAYLSEVYVQRKIARANFQTK